MRPTKYSTIWFTLWIYLGLMPAGALADQPDLIDVPRLVPSWASPELSVLIQTGLTQNGELKSLARQAESLKAEVSVAGALEDPRIGVAIANLPTDTYRFDQEPMTQKQFFISQKFPWFGKLSLRSKKAGLQVLRQEALLQAKELELIRRIVDAYYTFRYVDAAQLNNEQLTELVAQLLRVAETRYATGKGLQQDVLQAQVEQSKLLNEKILLEQKRRSAEDSLNALLNRERFIRIETGTEPPYPGWRLAVAATQTKALEQSPRLEMRRLEIDQAEVGVELARKDYWPDLDVRFTYGQRDEDLNGRNLPDFISAGVTLNVPLWQNQRQDKGLEAALKQRAAAQSRYHDQRTMLFHQIDGMVVEVDQLQANYRLFQDALILQARQWAETSLTSYEVGQIEFNTMITAQMRLLDFELQAKKLLYDIYRKRAQLEELTGGSLPAPAGDHDAASGF